MEKKTKNSKRALAIGLAVGLVFGVYFLYNHLLFVETDNAQIEGHSLLIASKVSGYITKVLVNDGQKVKAGDILVEINSEEYEHSLNQISSELISLEAKKNELERTYHRNNELFHSAAISRAQFDQASSAYNEIKAKHTAVVAQVGLAKLNLDNTKIKAPNDGFIARKSAEVGQLATPGMPLIGFVDSKERWVIANFKETDIYQIKQGGPAEVKVDAYSSKTYSGEIESIGPATGATFTLLPPDNATGNFTKVVQRVPVKIKLNQLSEQDITDLKAGLSALIKIRVH